MWTQLAKAAGNSNGNRNDNSDDEDDGPVEAPMRAAAYCRINVLGPSALRKCGGRGAEDGRMFALPSVGLRDRRCSFLVASCVRPYEDKVQIFRSL